MDVEKFYLAWWAWTLGRAYSRRIRQILNWIFQKTADSHIHTCDQLKGCCGAGWPRHWWPVSHSCGYERAAVHDACHQRVHAIVPTATCPHSPRSRRWCHWWLWSEEGMFLRASQLSPLHTISSGHLCHVTVASDIIGRAEMWSLIEWFLKECCWSVTVLALDFGSIIKAWAYLPLDTLINHLGYCGDDRVEGFAQIRECLQGSDMFISVWNLHRSPALWDQPDKFIPERFGPLSVIPNEVRPC